MKKLTKKMTALISLVCISILISIYGCSNEDVYNEHNLLPTSNYENNPYEFVGEYHNEGLAQILHELKEKAKVATRGILAPPTINEIKMLTETFCQNNVLESKGVQYPIDTKNSLILNSKILPSTRSINTQCSSDVQYYLSLFEHNLKNPQEINSLDDFLRKIKNIEQEIYNSDIQEEDKAVLLISYAVGRHSLEFWLEVSGLEVVPLVKTRGESFSDWWSHYVTPAIESVVTADFAGAAAGALGGMIAGGTVGTVVPGPGTVTGAIAGAVEGAASGAIYSSVVDGVVYYFSK